MGNKDIEYRLRIEGGVYNPSLGGYEAKVLFDGEVQPPPKQIKKKTMFRTVYQIGNFSEYRTSNHLSESFDQAKNLMPNTENARFVGAIEVEVCYEE